MKACGIEVKSHILDTGVSVLKNSKSFKALKKILNDSVGKDSYILVYRNSYSHNSGDDMLGGIVFDSEESLNLFRLSSSDQFICYPVIELTV